MLEDIPRGGFPSRLPSPRAITQGIKGNTEPPSLFASHQMPLWGQFLAHDLTKLGELKGNSLLKAKSLSLLNWFICKQNPVQRF